MKHLQTFESFDNSSVDEGLFSFLKGLFKNPMQKRKLDQLADKLTKTRIEIGTLKLEGDPVEELENELKDKSDDYTSSREFASTDNNPHEARIEILQNMEDEIIAMMDEIGQDNETLQKYVSKVKLESRMQSTEKLMRVADDSVAKILAKLKKKDMQRIKQADKDLYAMREMYMAEAKSEDDENPCWTGYEMVGMKKKGGKKVPNCVPVKESEETYNDYPAAAKANAKKAIEWKEKYGRDEVTGGTEVGWARAHQLAKGESLSKDVVSRMAQFNRHRKNSEVASEYKNEPWKDRGYIAWLIWGGTEGVDWAIDKMDQINNASESN